MSHSSTIPLAWSHFHRFRKYARMLERVDHPTIKDWLLEKKLHYRTMMLERICVRYVRSRKAAVAAGTVHAVERILCTGAPVAYSHEVRAINTANPFEVLLAVLFGDRILYDPILEAAIHENLTYVWRHIDLRVEVVISTNAAQEMLDALRGVRLSDLSHGITAARNFIASTSKATVDEVARQLEEVGWQRDRIAENSET